MVKKQKTYIKIVSANSRLGFSCGSVVKNLLANAGDVDSIPGLGKSTGEGNDNVLQYSGLRNPMDRWWATVHGVTKELTCLQFSSVAQSCLNLCNPMDCSTPGFPVHHQLPEPTQTHVHCVGDAIHLMLFYPLLLLPSIFPSIRIFSKESSLCIKWPKYWSFNFSISPSNEYSGLISFRMDWLDLLAVQGTLKSLLQHHSLKASIFRCSAFFVVQLSHPYMTTGKTTALTRWTFVDKVMSLPFPMLSRLVITFHPRIKCLLISWLQSPSAAVLKPRKIKSLTISNISPSICHEVMGPDAMMLVF